MKNVYKTEKIYGHRLVTESSQNRHRLVTDWSQKGHRLVTDWSQTGHRLVTAVKRGYKRGYKVVTYV